MIKKNNDSLAATCLISDSWEHQLGPPASSPICSCAQLSSYHDGRCQPALKKGVNNNTHESNANDIEKWAMEVFSKSNVVFDHINKNNNTE